MDFVMVPVPEEHVVDVMQYVTRLVARAGVEPWTNELINEFYDGVDEASRSLLSLVARATAAAKDLTEDDAAEALELSVREIRAITRDIYDETQRQKRQPLCGVRDTEVTLRNGRTVEQRVFSMTDPVARMIRSHERGSLGGEESSAASVPE